MFDDLRERFLLSNSQYKKRVFHIESNNLGWSLKEGKRDALRKKRRFIIRHVCTLRQSLPTGLVKKYTLDQWGRDTLLILPLVTFLSLLGYHHRGYKAHVWKISHFTFDRLWKLVSSFTWSSLSSKWSRDFKIIDRIINLKFLNSCEFHKELSNKENLMEILISVWNKPIAFISNKSNKIILLFLFNLSSRYNRRKIHWFPIANKRNFDHYRIRDIIIKKNNRNKK